MTVINSHLWMKATHPALRPPERATAGAAQWRKVVMNNVDPEIAALQARVVETEAAYRQAQHDLREVCRARCGIEIGDIVVGQSGKRWVVTMIYDSNWPVGVYGYPEAKSADKSLWKMQQCHRQIHEPWLKVPRPDAVAEQVSPELPF